MKEFSVPRLTHEQEANGHCECSLAGIELAKKRASGSWADALADFVLGRTEKRGGLFFFVDVKWKAVLDEMETVQTIVKGARDKIEKINVFARQMREAWDTLDLIVKSLLKYREVMDVSGANHQTLHISEVESVVLPGWLSEARSECESLFDVTLEKARDYMGEQVKMEAYTEGVLRPLSCALTASMKCVFLARRIKNINPSRKTHLGREIRREMKHVCNVVGQVKKFPDGFNENMCRNEARSCGVFYSQAKEF